ncbi:MAG: GTP-binding protein, partial [Clostridiales bacterium]|nr:GTP-binding protein [Clostridiales bacterium]
MELNKTTVADRIHIGIFGRRNAGKSSLINALTGQDFAIVSEYKGTTTDPISKAMELPPLGPVLLIDTPGLDDVGKLGVLRINKAIKVLNKCDIALLVIDATDPFDEHDRNIMKLIEEKKIPYVIVLNKSDLTDTAPTVNLSLSIPILSVSSKTGHKIHELKELIAKLARKTDSEKRIVADLISPGDFVVLVVPIDKGAPKGRLILPQQQTIRDILDSKAIAIVCQETELIKTLANLHKKPRL